ncbi:MAG: fibrobacter succinogenes major paralogous domain-containing protein, partial [Fibromonadaceae bacterium]|nr:fibrobacter succinogenes major paralogous domain-containing protein [Fibromonadaceae bacterium]
NYAGGEFEGGPNLKATHSWDDYQKTIDWETFEKETVSGNGFDAFGFAALAGGYFYAADGIDALNMFAAKGQYHGLGKQGYWWTATEYTNPNNGESIKATSRLIKNEAYHVQSSWENKGDNWFYVRCVKD